MYLTSITLQLAAFTYGIFWLKDSPRLPVEPSKDQDKKSFLADFFDRSHIYETFRVAFKQGKKNRRAKVIMLSIVVMLVMGPFYGKYILLRFRYPLLVTNTFFIFRRRTSGRLPFYPVSIQLERNRIQHLFDSASDHQHNW